MHLGLVGAIVLQLICVTVAARAEVVQRQSEVTLQGLAEDAYLAAEKYAKYLLEHSDNATCIWDTVRVRKEWGSLSKAERKAYVKAVRCLQSKSAHTPQNLAPGAKSRLDGYVVTHINQTMNIHFTGNFLVWHRYFTWLYESALRGECGYTGDQPYWDWAKSAETGLHYSPIFDGSETSLSGDGAYVANKSDIVLAGPMPGMPDVHLPSGTGGGCVTSGPFKNMTVNLGLVGLAVPGGEIVSNPDGSFAYNPRCLKRDLTDAVNKYHANASLVISNILNYDDIWDFQMKMQGIPGSGEIGIHGSGHYAIGGDPGRDVFISPGDPAFWLHHSNIDRVWWMWQMRDPETRIYSDKAISGTHTFLNSPPSVNTPLDDYQAYDFAGGPPRKIRDLMSTVEGPFCYAYL